MTAKDLLELLDAKDFKPIRVVMKSGKSYDIRFASSSFVTSTDLIIVPVVKYGSHKASHYPPICPIRNIATIEPLTGQAA